MATTHTITSYTYSELSDKAKKIALQNHSGINVDYNWWDNTYEDAKRIGLILTGFDLDRANYCKGHLESSLFSTCTLIMQEHGQNCETYKTAAKYLDAYNSLDEKSEDYRDNLQDLTCEFIDEICEQYKIILKHEYDYLTNDEQIAETMEVNDYQFLENGNDFTM